jgi:hypothetical protein
VSICWLASKLRSVNNCLVPVCWLTFELRSVVNSLVPVYWLASDLRSVVNSLARELTTDLSSEANQQTGTRKF